MKRKFNVLEKYIWDNVYDLNRTLSLNDFDDYIDDNFFYDSVLKENIITTLAVFQRSLDRVNKAYEEINKYVHTSN